jgi:hypothetical protein
VDVVASEEAKAYVRERGGVLYVRTHHHRCCGGGLTVLDSTTERPPDAPDFLSVGSGGIDVRFRGGREENLPAEVVIELRGILRRRPVAYWDGCAFRP